LPPTIIATSACNPKVNEHTGATNNTQIITVILSTETYPRLVEIIKLPTFIEGYLKFV